MSMFLEVLGQIDAKLKQMAEQAEAARYFANARRYDAAYKHALRLEEISERATLLSRVLPAYTGHPSAKKDVRKIIADTIPVRMGYTPQTLSPYHRPEHRVSCGKRTAFRYGDWGQRCDLRRTFHGSLCDGLGQGGRILEEPGGF